MRPDLDIWKPGEHNGTFRGHNLAFVTAAAAIETYWGNRAFANQIREKSWFVGERLHQMRETCPGILGVRGRGLIFGVECHPAELAGAISAEAYRRGLIIETSGSAGQVVKFLPPLTTDMDTLARGLDLFEESLQAALRAHPRHAAALEEALA
jgi:diaminobutyrate-2-oxoglutarate transaminase